MPIFKHKKENFWIIAAPKVMTSTMRCQNWFYTYKPSIRNFIYLSAMMTANRNNNEVWMLFRDPISRIKSFYRDAFQTHPERMLSKRESLQSNYWRVSQRVFFAHLGLSEKSSDKDISETLQATSFEAMALCLRDIWWKDPHLAPQVYQLNFKYKSLRLNIKPDKHLNIEDPNTVSMLAERAVDASMKKNRSGTDEGLMISDASLAFLKTIYAEDLHRLH